MDGPINLLSSSVFWAVDSRTFLSPCSRRNTTEKKKWRKRRRKKHSSTVAWTKWDVLLQWFVIDTVKSQRSLQRTDQTIWYTIHPSWAARNTRISYTLKPLKQGTTQSQWSSRYLARLVRHWNSIYRDLNHLLSRPSIYYYPNIFHIILLCATMAAQRR